MSELAVGPVCIEQEFLSERLAFLYSGTYASRDTTDTAGHTTLAVDMLKNRAELKRYEKALSTVALVDAHAALTGTVLKLDDRLRHSYELAQKFLEDFESPLDDEFEIESEKMIHSLPDNKTGASEARKRYDQNIADAREFVSENLQDIILIAAQEARASGKQIKTRHLYVVR